VWAVAGLLALLKLELANGGLLVEGLTMEM
jgi:hypothetical protein